MAIKELDQSRQATESVDGFSATVVYNVTGVSSETKALEHAGLPRIGDQHPERRGAIVLSVNSRTARGVEVFVVTVNYGVPQADQSFQPAVPGATGIIELGAASTVLSTNRDIITGDPIILKHTYVEQLATGDVDRRTETQGGEVEYEVTLPLLIQRRQETFAPVRRSQQYGNTINKFRIWGFEKETLLCLPITAISNDGGATYTVTYQFQAAITWLAEARFRDKTTGKPPVDIVQDIGIVNVNVFQKSDFSDLGLAFPGFR